MVGHNVKDCIQEMLLMTEVDLDGAVVRQLRSIGLLGCSNVCMNRCNERNEIWIQSNPSTSKLLTIKRERLGTTSNTTF